MRISIRNQLAALVLFSTLVGLAVISIATWVSNHALYISLRGSRMSTISSLKAAQMASNLAQMERSVRAMSTRVRVQEGLQRFNFGNNTDESWAGVGDDLQSALAGAGSQLLTLQTILFARSPGYEGGILNVTGPTLAGVIKLPFAGPNGSVWLGQDGLGYPPQLYPNFTYREIDGDNATILDSEVLTTSSNVFLGPLLVNSTFALFSLTVPIINNTSATDILGWITVVLDGSLVLEVVSSPVGLGDTGTTLLIGPNTTDNLLPANVTQGQLNQDGSIPYVTLRFVVPPDEQAYQPKRHPSRAYGETQTFPGPSFPIALESLVEPSDEPYNAGYDLDTPNEEGKDIAVGYAIVPSDFCQWLIVVETTKGEAYRLVDLLRKTLLACVFGTAGAAAILIFPVAHFSSRPIRRLRDATAKVMENTEPRNEDLDSPSTSATNEKADGYIGGVNKKQWFAAWFGSKQETVPVATHRPFRVPERVKNGKHLVEDELSDLTTTFNIMADELAVQYGRLEERVRQRTAELELSKKAAEAANESKSLFIANISHELKTPLNGILGMTAVCMQEDDPAKIKRSLGIIYKSGDLLHHLLTDLLTFSRNAMSKQLTLDEKEFRMGDIGAQLHAIFTNQAAEGKISFTILFQGPNDQFGTARGYELGQYGPDGLGRVKDMVLWGDSQRLLQVAINLISNSLKFTPAGGSVTLRIRCVDRLHPAVAARRTSLSSVDRRKRPEDGSQRRTSFSSSVTDMPPPGPDAPMLNFDFEVEDTGPGIPEHLQSQIFEPFVQGDLRLTKKFGGTGLGLSICSQISQLMHGNLHLKSEEGHGATFKLSVPLKLCRTRADSLATSVDNLTRASSFTRAPSPPNTQDGKERAESPSRAFEDAKPRLVGLSQPYFSTSSPPMGSPASDSDKRQGKLRVLVAEDNVVNAEVVTRMLKLEEIFDVTLAKDGQEALDKVKESMEGGPKYDLIFMDIQMPNLDGRQSTRLIREIGFSAPIVALTAFSDEINQKECMDSGMDYFLAKPIKRPALKHVLKTYCAPILEEGDPQSSDGSPRETSHKSARDDKTDVSPLS